MLNFIAPIIIGLSITASSNVAVTGQFSGTSEIDRSHAKRSLNEILELPKTETIVNNAPSREINTSL